MRSTLIISAACVLSLLIGFGFGMYLLTNQTKMYQNLVLSQKLLVLSGIVKKYNSDPTKPNQLALAVCDQIEAESMEVDEWHIESDDIFDPRKTRDLLRERAASLCGAKAEVIASVAQ
ncbi:MAG: hypothetical protein AAGF57_20970 [Pseudomonadota bacterium]